MSALRKDIQRQLFQADDERIHTIIHVVKIDGKKKKRPTYLCIAVTTEHPISVRIYIVKAEREEIFKKKERFHLREVREVDGINPKKSSADFYLSVADRNFSITAGSAEEKDEFIRDLYKLSAHYMPVQMPDFCNVSLPVDQRESDILPVETDDHEGGETICDYQPVSVKEEADFRRLLAKAEIKIGEADKFAEILSAQLQSLDGANIQSMMNSETAVNQLLSLIDGALDRVSQLDREVDTCDSILSRERNSVELIEEKDSLSVVERRNKERLRQQLIDYVAALDAVTDKHIRTLEEARLDDPASIARCADAARAVSQFWHGRVPKALLQMRSYQDRNQKLDVIDMFVDRLISHFSALFNNLNDISMSQDWGSLSIPKQSQRYHALSPLSDLMSWLKANRPVPYNAAIERYVQATSNLYRRLFEQFFNALIADVQKTALSGKRQNSSTLSGKVSLDKSSFSTLDFTTDSEVSEQLTALIQTVLGELGPVVDSEQKFCVRFFHINSELLSAAETSSTGSGDSSNIGGRNLERYMNEQVRSVMQPLMQSLNEHLKRFAEAICKQNSSNVLLLFVILSKKVLAPQDPGSYFSVTFGTLVVLIKRQFDLYMEAEAKLISEIKISKRLRIGILPTIDRFAQFIRNAELIFEHAERRTDLEKWYAVLFRSVCEGVSRAANNPNSKSPASVVRFENYHQLYLTLSELKLTCLDSQRKESKLKKEENISIYVRESLGKPLEKVSLFFDQVTNAIARAGVKPEEISYQQQFSRLELKKVINMYSAKEVKKGLDQLYRKVEKQLIDHSSLLQVVWREMQDQFIKQIQEYQMIMSDCYPGSKIDLEVSIDDVLRFFSEIAQEH